MKLRHFRHFVAVAEELLFGRAAERLHVSRPPLSQLIKQLEEEVEVRLFDRNKRWVRLTGTGRQFLEDARPVLTQADGAVLAARRTMGGECDVVRAPLRRGGFRGYCARAPVRGQVDDTFRMSVRRTE